MDLMLRDVGDEPGALPLLSHALLETWKRRAGRTMILMGYADAGGVRGAIAHTAETTYQQLSSEQQEIARSILLRLTELGEGTEDTRRRASLDELSSNPDTATQTREVLNRRQHEVAKLRDEKRQLEQRLATVGTGDALIREARRLGLVKPGERLFIVRGISAWRQKH